MSDRDELAWIAHKACGCDGTCAPDAEDWAIADAILARWRLVPVVDSARKQAIVDAAMTWHRAVHPSFPEETHGLRDAVESYLMGD